MSNKFGFSVWPWMRQEGVIRRLTKDQAIQEYAGRVLVFDVANTTFGRPTVTAMNAAPRASQRTRASARSLHRIRVARRQSSGAVGYDRRGFSCVRLVIKMR